MTDSTPTANGVPNGNGAAHDRSPPRARVVAQFIKDLSFEVPRVERLVEGPGENPNLQLEVNVNARQVEGPRFESIIEFTANATDSSGTIYQLEAVYGGLFDLEPMPQEALEPFLLINCPATLFPFLRRLIADITRESGFPPLMLDPLDFAQLYEQRKSEGAVESKSTSD